MIELTTPYSKPTLRPCERIEPEPDETIRVGLQQRYSALKRHLERVIAAILPRARGNPH